MSGHLSRGVRCKLAPLHPLDRLEADRLNALLPNVRREVEQASHVLRALGVDFRIVGSWARGEFRLDSGIDFLVLDAAGHLPGEIHEAIASQLPSVPFDLVMAEELRPERLAFMLQNAELRSGGHPSRQAFIARSQAKLDAMPADLVEQRTDLASKRSSSSCASRWANPRCRRRTGTPNCCLGRPQHDAASGAARCGPASAASGSDALSSSHPPSV